MPTNRPELQLRSSSRRHLSGRRGRNHGTPSRAGDKSYAAPSGRHVKRVSFARDASAPVPSSVPSSVASSTAASTATRGSAGAENDDPQQQQRRSNQPPQPATKATSAKATPPEVSLEDYPRTAAAPLLPFEQFRQLRREGTNHGGRMPVLPMERAAARRDVRQPEGAWSFDEFRAMQRLLPPPKERAAENAVGGKVRGEGKPTKKQGKKKYGAGSLKKKKSSPTSAQGSRHFRAVFDVFGTDAAAARAGEALGGAKKGQEKAIGSLVGSPVSLALPRGMPRVLTVPEDWEAQAGFAFDRAVRDETPGGEAEDEEEEIDPRNASTWAVCDDNEHLDADDATEIHSPDVTAAKTPTSNNQGERLSLELGVEVDDRLGEFSPVPSHRTEGDATETGSRLDALLGMTGRDMEFGGERERHLGSTRGVPTQVDANEKRAEKYRRGMHEKEEKMIRAAKKAGRKARKSLNGKIDAVLEVAQVNEVTRKSRESLNYAPASKTKGRVLLVRIRRRISRLTKAKGALTKLFGKFHSNHANDSPEGTELVTDVHLFVPSPRSDEGPVSPSAVSVLSVASSVVDRHGANVTVLLGAAPVKSGLIPPELLYGAIDYASTYDGDELPSPPAEAALPRLVASADEEDAVSYLAAAMKNYGSEEDGENGGRLLLTPRENGTIGGAMKEANDGDATNHGRALVHFSGEGAGIAPGTPLQIVDALEVEGGYLLTPSGKTNEGATGIFRFSTHETANLLPDSAAGSDSDEEEEALLFHGDAPILKVDSDCNATVVAVDQSDDSPSNASHFIGDVQVSAKTAPKKKSPTTKAVPKSASKTRGGLVKGRIGALQRRLDGGGATAGQLLSTASSFDGGARGGASRRGGGGYIRSVPIGIAKTYSRESVGSGSIGPRDGARYAQKYTLPHPVRSVPIGIAKSYSRDSSDGSSIGYAKSFEGREE